MKRTIRAAWLAALCPTLIWAQSATSSVEERATAAPPAGSDQSITTGAPAGAGNAPSGVMFGGGVGSGGGMGGAFERYGASGGYGAVSGMAPSFLPSAAYPSGVYPADNALPVTATRLVFFSAPDLKAEQELHEDLMIMSQLLRQNLQAEVAQSSPTYRMGVPLLLTGSGQTMQLAYIEGFGALFTIHVNFPLLPPPLPAPEEANANKPPRDDDWERAKAAMFGAAEPQQRLRWAMVTAQSGSLDWAAVSAQSVPFDPARVEALKNSVVNALKFAANIRRLKPDDSVAVVVDGAESVARVTQQTPPGATQGYESYPRNLMPAERSARAGAGRPTVLTMRVRYADAEAFAKGKLSFDQFKSKIRQQSYLGLPTGGPTVVGASAGMQLKK